MQPDAQEILARIHRGLGSGDLAALDAFLNELHPADIAEVMGRLDPEEQQQVLGLLETHEEAEVLEYADEEVRSEIVSSMPDQEVSDIVEEMPPEEAADLLSEMPEERAEHVLELMADEEAEEVEDLLRYPPESAGGIMAPVVATVRDDQTVSGLLGEIRSNDELEEEDIYSIYVVDAESRVQGIVELWDLLRASPDTPVRELMETVQTIRADTDQEKVAALFGKYDMVSGPVVDGAGRLLGRIVFDDVQDVVRDEQSEDMSKLAGTHEDELASSSAVQTARLRLPWLIICLVGTLLSGIVLHHHEATLREFLILMFFVPAVMATAGNSGLQTATMTVRSMATGHADRMGPTALILKQIKVAMMVGLVCGLLAGVAGAVWSHFSPAEHLGTSGAVLLGLIIGGSMCAAICVSCTMGVSVPFTFRKMGIDPAVASGPLIMTVTDIFSLIVYLGVARTLLGKFA
ncbi:magnesium transporter [Planctomycetota bacterium]